jgi:hypothetical protein
MIHQLNNLFRPPKLSRRRIALAVIVALVADGLQIPFQLMPPAIAIIDVVAAVITVLLLGFHVLLLPTFIIELFPIVDIAPTWTGCVMAVIYLRKREPSKGPPPVIPVEPSPPRIEPKSLPTAEGGR